LDTLRRIALRTGGLSLVVLALGVIALVVPSVTVTRWFGFVAFAVVMAAIGWWASRDGHVTGFGDGLRDWLVIAFLLGVGWWIVLTLFEGERDVVGRLGVDFWSVMATIGMVFVAALVGMLYGRAQPKHRSSGDTA
jgi:hypothetical protein